MTTLRQLLNWEELPSPVEPPRRRPLRFGEIAIHMGYVDPVDVNMALAVQRLGKECGERHRMLGEILVDMGCISKTQVLQILDSYMWIRRRAKPKRKKGRLRCPTPV